MYKDEVDEIQRLKESNKVIEIDDLSQLKHDPNVNAIFAFSKNVIETLRFCDKNCIRTLLVDTHFVQNKKTGIIEELQEKYEIKYSDFDIICGSFEKRFGLPGGFACGSELLIGNMRTMAPGYCFSASCPPSVCAILRILIREALE